MRVYGNDLQAEEDFEPVLGGYPRKKSRKNFQANKMQYKKIKNCQMKMQMATRGT